MGKVVSLEEKRKAGKRRRRVGSIRWVFIVLLLLAAIGGGYALANSPLFEVAEFRVTGVETLDAEQVVELSGIETGDSMFAINFGYSALKIESNIWVDSAKVSRSFPNKINIEIVEKKAIAAIAHSGVVLLFDDDGYVLETRKLLSGMPVMLITGVDDLFRDDIEKHKNDSEQTVADILGEENSVLYPAGSEEDESGEGSDSEVGKIPEIAPLATEVYPGQHLSSDKLDTGLAVVSQMTTEAGSLISEIDVSNTQDIVARTTYGISIRLGDETDFLSKYHAAKVIIEQEDNKGLLNKVKYIDVSLPELPTLRYND